MSDFDISDGKNQYRPCRKCGNHFEMGLRHRKGTLAVEYTCGHRGPEIAVPPMDDPGWAANWNARDKAAFDAWNTESDN